MNIIQQSVGSTLTNLCVDENKFSAQVVFTTTVFAEFSFNGTNWSYNGNTITTADLHEIYGILFMVLISTVMVHSVVEYHISVQTTIMLKVKTLITMSVQDSQLLIRMDISKHSVMETRIMIGYSWDQILVVHQVALSETIIT